MTLGEKIQELRRRSGMSQDELAEKLEVSRQAVSKWERDEAIPETEKIVRIAQVFRVSTDYLLLAREEVPRPEPNAAASSAQPTAGQQVLRGMRRHGYKAGYALLAAGGLVCAIALLIALLVPSVGSGAFDMFDGFTDSAQGMVDNSGFGSMGGFDSIFGMFDQQVDKMEDAWTSGTSMIAWMAAGPMLLIGVALLIGGVVVIVKGKKIAKAAV